MARSDRRDQLLDLAEQVFLEKGFPGASMDDVAERAGVTKPVLYDHFGSKDGLLAGVVERLGHLLLESTAAAVAPATSPEDALRRGLTAYFRFVDAHSGAWTLLLQQVPPGSLAAAAAGQVRTTQVASTADLVNQNLPASDRQRALTYAHVISGAAERLAELRVSGRRMSAERATEQLMDVLWTGLAQLSGTRCSA